MNEIKNDPFASIKFPEYRNLIAGRFLFIMGLRMMGTLVGWWVYNLTNDPFAIGLIGLSEVIPAITMALYAGHIIDLSEKRKVLLTGVALYFTAVLVLLFLSTSYTSQHLTNHWIAIWIYVIIFFTGIIRAFTGPTMGVLVAQIVPKEILQNATTWNQGTWLSASVTGHAVAGFLIAAFDISGTLIAVCTLIIVICCVLYR